MTILENYLKSKKVQKALTTKPGEEGFSLVELVVVIAVLAILAAVALPAFDGVRANARASAVKNGLTNAIKECIVLASTDTDSKLKSTDVQTVSAGVFNGYSIAAYNGDSCYSLKATASSVNVGDADFTIELDTSTGVVAKDCEKKAPGCPTSKKW